jgi:hypothetical protein
MWAIFSSSSVPLTSEAPKCSATDHDPVRLDVREVVEEEARGRDGAKVVRGRRLARHELRGADLIGQGDEGEEAAAPVLLLAQPQEMLDPLRHGLDVAVEHGRVGLDPERMRDAVDLEPAIGIRLARVVQLLLKALREDLRPAARHRMEPRLLEPRQRLSRLDLPPPPEVVDLRGGERLDLGLGTGGVDGPDHPLVVVEGPVGMVAAHDVRLAGARLDHVQHVLDGVLEGALFALLSREVAEGARQHADVGRVDVAIQDEKDLLAVPPRFGEIRHAAEAVEVLRFEEELTVFTREPDAVPDLVPDGREAGITEEQGTGCGSQHDHLCECLDIGGSGRF